MFTFAPSELAVGIRFSETMRGTLRACDSGAPLLTTLDATIYVPHTAEALCGRPMLIRGQLCLGAGSTPYEVEGDLTLDFLGTRR